MPETPRVHRAPLMGKKDRAPLALPETSLDLLERRIEACRACPRLVRFREQLAAEGKDRSGVPFWGKPVPGFGDERAWLMVVGLAPGARGSNRTGRMFTGDRSADFLVSALHRAGFANQPTSTSIEDGLVYQGLFLTAAVRCVPPLNKPSPAEARRCGPYLEEEMRLLPEMSAILALGRFAWDASYHSATRAFGIRLVKKPFSHGASLRLGAGLPTLWASYHPSPQNTQTGLLTRAKFDALLTRIKASRSV